MCWFLEKSGILNETLKLSFSGSMGEPNKKMSVRVGLGALMSCEVERHDSRKIAQPRKLLPKRLAALH